MRSLMRDRPQVLFAYVLIVLTTSLGFWRIEQNRDRDEERIRQVACAVTAPIPLAPDVPANAFSRQRTAERNAQLAKERLAMIGDNRC